MRKLFIGCYNKSVILTYIGITIALYGMLFAKDINIMMVCLIIAGICDLFDGFIARKCKRTDLEKQFGIQIDSLCDVISFLVYPIVILFKMTETVSDVLIMIIGALYLITGITRLAWFNISTDGHTKYYQGLPVTFDALIIPLVYLVLRNVPSFQFIIIGVYTAIAILFVLNVKIRKPTGIWYGIFSLMAIITSTLLLAL